MKQFMVNSSAQAVRYVADTSSTMKQNSVNIDIAHHQPWNNLWPITMQPLVMFILYIYKLFAKYAPENIP